MSFHDIEDDVEDLMRNRRFLGDLLDGTPKSSEIFLITFSSTSVSLFVLWLPIVRLRVSLDAVQFY